MNLYILQRKAEKVFCKRTGFISQSLFCLILFVFADLGLFGQNPIKNFTPGSYIIDMGQPSQTIANGLKPYGLVYQLIVTGGKPVNWAINSSKVKDGIDFSADGKDYKGGSFIISSDYITAFVITLINTWKAKGVKVDGPIVSAFNAPVYKELTSWPVAVLDGSNDGLIAPYYNNAEVPTSSYKLNANPTMLPGCTGGDLYVLPHADPNTWDATWITALQNYINNGGYVWAGCHAVSVLANIPGCNFLSTGGLVPFGDHSNSIHSLTYNSSAANNPIMQFMGILDGAVSNGSEQIYVPEAAGWRSTTTQAIYDATYSNTKSNISYSYPNAATVLAFGPAFGDNNKGTIMYEAGHSLNNGTTAEKVAAQRAYFNFVLMAGVQKQINISYTYPAFLTPGGTDQLNATVNGGTLPYTYLWSSDGGGTFSSTSTNPTNFTAPLTSGDIIIKLKVTDACGRINFTSVKMEYTIPLPIELLSFYAKPENNFINITWSTASEKNNDYFTIEKSKDGLHFETVSSVDGAGNSTSVINYKLKDYQPFDGHSYYRLSQTDFDGTITHSDMVNANFNRKPDFSFKIYPNPNDGVCINLEMIADKGKETELVMTDINGKVMYTKEIIINSNEENVYTFCSEQRLPPGIYFVKISSANKEYTKKVVVE